MAAIDLSKYTFYTRREDLTAEQRVRIAAAVQQMVRAGTAIPEGDGFGLCGEGTDWQANIAHYSMERIILLDVPNETDSDYHRKLAKAAHKVNRKFERKALRIIRKLRKQTGDDSLEVTIHLAQTGLRPVIVRSIRRMKNAGVTMAPSPETPAVEARPPLPGQKPTTTVTVATTAPPRTGQTAKAKK